MIITRFAPSPTGYLHLGNVRTALFNWLMAAQAGGKMQLRVEDTDRDRSQERYTAALIEDLQWLGLDFAGDAGGAPWRQSQRAALYAQQLERLREHAYPCFCTNEALAEERRRQLAAGKPPRYSGVCARLAAADARRRQSAGEPHALRFRVPPGVTVIADDQVRGKTVYQSDDLGDFILRRAAGGFSFLFANAVDDALLGVTNVLRGEDHTANTPRQLLLLQALQFAPPRYAHIALMVGAGGKPLSKRDGLTPVRDWRAQGYRPDALLNYLARVGHQYSHAGGDALMTRAALAEYFSVSALGRAPAQYDKPQLLRRQKESVLQLGVEEYRHWLGEERLQNLPDAGAFYQLTRENVLFPQEADHWAQVITQPLPPVTADAAEVIRAAGEGFYRAAAAADGDTWQTFCAAVSASAGRKGKALYLPLRAALTGKTDGPAMPLLYGMLPADLRQRRFDAAARHAAASDSMPDEP